MLKVKKISHLAVAVADMDQALAQWQQVLGVAVEHREVVASQQTETAMLPVGDVAIELITPRGSPGLAKFLETRGPGLHHVAVEVEGIEEALAFLQSLGVPLIDREPRVGAHGHKVAFLHPRATGGVLIELVEPQA